ncbi:MAG: aldose epimerase [Actinomycetota bacterium]
MIELEAGSAVVTIEPSEGGRVAQIKVDGQPLLHDDRSGGPMTWGSFPMAPWAGRVRRGEFRFDELPYRLPLGLPPHAIHGTTYLAEWAVDDAGHDYCDLRTALTWPFGGIAQQHLQLDDGGLLCVLTVAATMLAMPATIGWHPCFRRPLEADLDFEAMYVRDAEHIATPRFEPPKAHPWDDCFVRPLGPLRLHYRGLRVTLGSDCDHWVVYDGPENVTCVEPQSGPPDAFNIGGATDLQPGDLLQRHFSIRWDV